ncbi:MAG: hypothetical protein JJW00_01005 [Sulfurimonas sp.]|nr:hypothetical protein [Sulfurimonas sp.]
MSYVDRSKKYVTSYKEISIIFIFFSIILFVIFPKELILRNILAENSNYDLSMLYLKNMLKNDPKNENLMLMLATQSIKSGKKDLAYKLLELLKNSKDRAIRSQAYTKSYTLAKENYFYFQSKGDELKKDKYFSILKELFKTIKSEDFYSSADNQSIFKESLFVHDSKNAYKYALKEISKEIRVKNLESVYYLSLELKNFGEALQILEKLTVLDAVNKSKWREASYFVVSSNYSQKGAELFLREKAEKSRYWQSKFAEHKVKIKEYKQASSIYMGLFNSEKNYKKKKKFFYKTIENLNASNDKKYAVNFAKSHESYYFQDKEVRYFILKLYLGNGSLNSAADLSQKILKKIMK